MVKVQAPCLSLNASGTIAGAMTFSSWKGRPYVRETVKPSNPKSGSQVGVRAMFKFLAQDWSNLTTVEKASWEDRADQTVISNFNAFMAYNQRRWRNFLAPSGADPATEDDGCPVVSNEAATAAVRQITIAGDVAAKAGDESVWGVAIFRSPTGTFTTAFSNCIAVIPADDDATYSYVDTPLDPGQYYYNTRLLSEVGDLDDENTEVDATVT